ncbi:MAG: hypothetical protein ACI9OJ_000243, partial [Myxococcota bacterium]
MRLTVAIFALLMGVMPTEARASDPGLDAALAPFLELAPRCAPDVTWCFSIALHIVVREDGFPVVTPTWLQHQLAETNRYFAGIDVNFQVESVDALPATDEVVKNRRHRDLLGRDRY